MACTKISNFTDCSKNSCVLLWKVVKHAILISCTPLFLIEKVLYRQNWNIVPFVPTLMLYLCFVRKRSVKLVETSLLGRKRNVPSTSISTAPPKSCQPSVSFEDDAPPSKRKKDSKVRLGHRRHRPETKAKIDLFKKIRSSEKSFSEIKNDRLRNINCGKYLKQASLCQMS